MLKTDSRVEYCHSQSIASFLMVPTDLMMALDFTIVHPHGQLDQPTDLKKTTSLGEGGKVERASLLSELDDPTRQLQEHTTGRREHGPFGIILKVWQDYYTGLIESTKQWEKAPESGQGNNSLS